MGMFEFVETRIDPDGKAEVKRHASDEEFQEACDQFVIAEKRFCKINLHVRLHDSADTSEWWEAVERRYTCEKKVWELFTAGERSPRMGRLYLQFRDALLSGKSLRADAESVPRRSAEGVVILPVRRVPHSLSYSQPHPKY